jgi:DNA-binding protein H-NS
MIGTIGAYVTGWLATKWLSWLGSMLGWVWWAITTTIKGIFSFLQDPKETFAVAIIAAVTFAHGAWLMYGFIGYRVKTVEAQMTALWQDMSKKDREDAQRAAEARAARIAAEAAERQRQINETNTKKLPNLSTLGKSAANPAGAAASAHPPAVAGVRDKPAPVRGRKCEQGLFGCL